MKLTRRLSPAEPTDMTTKQENSPNDFRHSSNENVLAASPGRLLLQAVLAAAVCLSVGGCKKAPEAAAPPPMVEVMTVTATNAPASVEFIGQLDSPQNVEIRA